MIVWPSWSNQPNDCFELYELWTHPSHHSTSFCPRAWFQVILISQSWPRTCSRVHLNFAFFDLCCNFFLDVFEILDQPCRCFWSFESSFFTVLAIVIRRLLYVPGYVIGSLNSSFIWSLSLQLVEYNSNNDLVCYFCLSWWPFYSRKLWLVK